MSVSQQKDLVLGIDATNLRHGGGLTHLVELLAHANPSECGFRLVNVWGGEQLSAIEPKPWLVKNSVVSESDSYLRRTSWARRHLVREAKAASCDLIFAPGGTFSTKRMPYVSMSQNMLLFDDDERRRFPWGRNRVRYNLLRFAQRKSFLYAKGIVFISQYAQKKIGERFPFVRDKPSKVIYHGVSRRFSRAGKSTCEDGSLRLLYVSRVNYYKHQWNVIEAVKRLRRDGVSVQLKLVGEDNEQLASQMKQAMDGTDHDAIQMIGEVPYDQIEKEYQAANAFVFASTCENMPNILLEAMAAGLPIACSDYGPMPEIMGDSGIYFDPLNVESIEAAIRALASDSGLMSTLSEKSLLRASGFSWERSAVETLEFLRSCAGDEQASDFATPHH